MAEIYKIVSPSNKIYIGQSKNCEHRKIYYRTLNCKGQPKLYNSLKKYGWESHTFEIVESTDKPNEREIYWICYYNSVENGLNCSFGGEGGGNKSDQTKQKISQSMKGKNTWSVGGYTKKPILQYSLDGEFIKEWNDSSSPKINNIGNCANGILKSAGGYIWIFTKDFTPELLLEKINTSKSHNNKGKFKTTSHKQNISKSKLGAFKKGKQIIQYNMVGEFVKEWGSIKHASEALNIRKSSISSNLKKRYKSAGGYIWKYKNIL
jgi:group I intron endonuclease